jgi:hypothetical protein
MMLGDGKRCVRFTQAEPIHPFLAGCRLFYSKEKAICRHKLLKTQKAASLQCRPQFISRASS